MAKKEFLLYNNRRGCKGFDLAMKHLRHAEGVSWPLKKTDKLINGNKVVSIFSQVGANVDTNEAELAQLAA